MADYKISEIADIFNISKQMVRYYEQCGVIHPQRGDNNYRTYSSQDFFSLGEVIYLQYLDVTIKDSKQFFQESFISKKAERYKEKAKQLDQEIHYNELFSSRCKQLSNEIEFASLNIGHYFIKRIPKLKKYKMMESHDDHYEKVICNKEVSHYFFNSKYSIFQDTYVEFLDEKEKWYFSIEEDYFSLLNLESREDELVESTLCLCTTIDMEEMGHFNHEKIQPLLEYARNNHYEIIGNVYGILRGRGNKEGKYSRQFEIRVPIKSVQ